MSKWNATYRIKESPKFAQIGPIYGEETEAREYAEDQVGTDLLQWGHPFRLLELLGISEEVSK